jgi:hypothetical protein
VVPGSNEFADKIAFTWQLIDLNENEIKIDMFFNDTDYVAMDEANPDTMVVTFYNTNRWLKPIDDSK